MADDLLVFMEHCPQDHPQRELLVDFVSGIRETGGKFEVKYAAQLLSGKDPDPRMALNHAVSLFSKACVASVRTVTDIQTAAECERVLTALLSGVLDWFVTWLPIAIPARAEAAAKEWYPVLNRRLWKVLGKAKVDAWKAARSSAKAPVSRGELLKTEREFPRAGSITRNPPVAAVGVERVPTVQDIAAALPGMGGATTEGVAVTKLPEVAPAVSAKAGSRTPAGRKKGGARNMSKRSGGQGSVKHYRNAIGRNIDRLRKECGWGFATLAKATELEKKLILGHVNKGKGAHPSTLERYAHTFSEKLGRPVTVAELEA